MEPKILLSKRPKIWTKRGLATLGKLIRVARISNGLTLEDVTRLIYEQSGIKLSKKTIGNIENAVGEPKYNSVAAIASAGFVQDPLGRLLDESDFIDIASEYKQPQMSISRLIAAAMEANGLSQEEVEEELLDMQQKGTAKMTIDRLREIQRSSTVSDDELRIIRVLVDRYETLFTEDEWLLEAQKKPADYPQEDNGVTNGKY